MRIDGAVDRLGEADTALGHVGTQLGHRALQRRFVCKVPLSSSPEDVELVTGDLVVRGRERAT